MCKKSFVWKRPKNRLTARYSWFLLWLNGSSVKTISQLKHKSTDVILETIYWYLDNPPKPNPSANLSCNLVIDATWFGREECLIVYWDPRLKKSQWWRLSKHKEKAYEIIADLRKLKQRKVTAVSVTSDGSPGVKAGLNIIYPNIPHQRCLVHLQRMCLVFLTKNPKTLPGLRLRNLALKLNKVDTHEKHYLWQSKFYHWCNQYYSFLKEKSYSFEKKNWWYTHRSLRKVRRMVANVLPSAWHYLDDSNINKDTNGLEGRWSSLKQHYRQHRGLSKKRRLAYFSWYLSVVVNQEKPTLEPY